MGTYMPLYTQTLASAAASIDFSSITQAYNHLVVVCSVRSTDGASTVDLLMRSNNASGNIYDGLLMRASGSSQTTGRYNNSSFAAPVGLMVASSATAGVFSQHEIHLNRYSDSSFNKPFVARSASVYASGVGASDLVVNAYFATAAINRLTFLPSAGNFAIGSTVTIYGILAAA